MCCLSLYYVQLMNELQAMFTTPKQFLAELSMLCRFSDHPRIMQVLGVVLWPDRRVKYIVTELAHGSLLDLLRKGRTAGACSYVYQKYVLVVLDACYVQVHASASCTLGSHARSLNTPTVPQVLSMTMVVSLCELVCP